MPEKERFVGELCRVAAPGVCGHHSAISMTCCCAPVPWAVQKGSRRRHSIRIYAPALALYPSVCRCAAQRCESTAATVQRHSPSAAVPAARVLFVLACHRVVMSCAGGRVIVVTWCHRVLQPGEPSLKPNERMLLDKICDAYYLPAWCSVAEYQRLFGESVVLSTLP